MRKCCLVMGTPRSGTSAIAGVLHNLGIPMGERIDDPDCPDRWDFLDPNDWNPKGFFQDAAFFNLENAEFGGYAPASNWTASNVFRDGLERLIAARCARGIDWGVKSNRLQFYLAEFAAACPYAIKVIVAERDMATSQESWRARSRVDTEQRGPDFIKAAREQLRQCDSTEWLKVDFDKLVFDTASQVQRIAECVGRSVTPEAIQHIDQSLKRF